MTRAPVIATALAKAADTYPENRCLQFARTRYGIDRKFATAAEAYAHTDQRSTDYPPPVGAFVWWLGGDGHVAISAGGGKVYTTDNPLEGAGEVGVCPIQKITTLWGKQFMGWSRDCNDVTGYRWSLLDLGQLRHAAHVDPSGDRLHPAYTAGTKQWEAALYLLGYLARDWAFDGYFGQATVNATSRLQQALGFKGSPDQPGTGADGIPGATTARLLGQRFHWQVT